MPSTAESARTALDCCISNDSDERARLGINVVSSSLTVRLAEMRNLREAVDLDAIGRATVATSRAVLSSTREPFLRIPPFPGAALLHFARTTSAVASSIGLAAEVCRLRVGGT